MEEGFPSPLTPSLSVTLCDGAGNVARQCSTILNFSCSCPCCSSCLCCIQDLTMMVCCYLPLSCVLPLFLSHLVTFRSFSFLYFVFQCLFFFRFSISFLEIFCFMLLGASGFCLTNIALHPTSGTVFFFFPLLSLQKKKSL